MSSSDDFYGGGGPGDDTLQYHEQALDTSIHSGMSSSSPTRSAGRDEVLPVSSYLDVRQEGATEAVKAYAPLDSRINSTHKDLIAIADSHQAISADLAAAMRRAREDADVKFDGIEEALDNQDDAMQKILAGQQYLLRRMAVQDKVVDLMRQINIIVQTQNAFYKAVQEPIREQLGILETLQKSQRMLLQSVGQSPLAPPEHLEFTLVPPAEVYERVRREGEQAHHDGHHDAHAPGSPRRSAHGNEPVTYTRDMLHRLPNQHIDSEALKFLVEKPLIGGMAPYPGHDPDLDAKVLRKAMKGWGTNEKKLLTVIGSRTREQRLLTAQSYNVNYKRDLLEDVKDETSGAFRDMLVALLMPAADHDALMVQKAVHGAGTNDTALIEVLCTRTNSEIREMKEAYKRIFSRTMEADVREDTSGSYQALLLAQLKATRDEEPTVDMALAKEDAANLYQAGENQAGTDEAVFIEIMTQRNPAQLRACFDHYSKLEDYDIEKSIERECSGNFKEGLLTIVQAARNKPDMFADRLHRAMKGMGTDKGTLIRILSSRSEIDLFDIAESYKRQFQQTLFSKIYSETFGDFRKLVLELFGDSEFDPEKDAKKLRKAMKGAGTNEAIINKIIAGRSLAQRQAILEAYNAMYKRDLLKDFHDELSGFYREMIMALMTDPSEFAAKEVKRAVQGIGTDDRSLIELICSRTGAELRPIKEAYERLYSTTMADDVRSDTSGDYRELLLALIQNERNDSERPNDKQARELASRLYKAGEGRLGTDEREFIDVLSLHSFDMLAEVFEHYAKLCDNDIERSITKEMSFEFKRALTTIVRVVRNPTEYYAGQLYKTMKGAGTEDRDLIRIMVLRSERDLKEIADDFFRVYKISLDAMIEEDTSKHFCKLLLRVLDMARRHAVLHPRPTRADKDLEYASDATRQQKLRDRHVQDHHGQLEFTFPGRVSAATDMAIDNDRREYWTRESDKSSPYHEVAVCKRVSNLRLCATGVAEPGKYSIFWRVRSERPPRSEFVMRVKVPGAQDVECIFDLSREHNGRGWQNIEMSAEVEIREPAEIAVEFCKDKGREKVDDLAFDYVELVLKPGTGTNHRNHGPMSPQRAGFGGPMMGSMSRSVTHTVTTTTTTVTDSAYAGRYGSGAGSAGGAYSDRHNTNNNSSYNNRPGDRGGDRYGSHGSHGSHSQQQSIGYGGGGAVAAGSAHGSGYGGDTHGYGGDTHGYGGDTHRHGGGYSDSHGHHDTSSGHYQQSSGQAEHDRQARSSGFRF